MKDQLAPLNLPRDLDSVFTLAIRLDTNLRDHQSQRREVTDLSPSSRGALISFLSTLPTGVEPMPLGWTRLPAEEHQRHLREGRFFYCGQMGHQVTACPAKTQSRVWEV